ncbi:MAG: DUF2782 domain-containing protein [Chromatiales bacterium]|nr:DUF2782 domain-containing protein [Chromatiales bacterium]
MEKRCLLFGLLLAVSASYAADTPEPEAVPEPPRLPPKVQSGEVLEPEVRIIESPRGAIEEYRVNGRLYMIKVIPQIGPAYFLVDSNGDGEMDLRHNHPADISVPQWVIFSW